MNILCIALCLLMIVLILVVISGGKKEGFVGNNIIYNVNRNGEIISDKREITITFNSGGEGNYLKKNNGVNRYEISDLGLIEKTYKGPKEILNWKSVDSEWINRQIVPGSIITKIRMLRPYFNVSTKQIGNQNKPNANDIFETRNIQTCGFTNGKFVFETTDVFDTKKVGDRGDIIRKITNFPKKDSAIVIQVSYIISSS